MTPVPDQRILLVHAHPDDETIQNGSTMAKYVAMGRGVTVVTCTAGEMGEILVPELEHLAADKEDGLGEHRRGELADAMKELGVTDHRFLGGFGTYRDSGMKWHDDGYAIPADTARSERATTTPSGTPTCARRPTTWSASSARCARRCWSPTTSSATTATPTTSRRTGCRRTPRRWPPCRPTSPTSARPGTSPRSTGARCPRAGSARCCDGCARRATPRPSRGWTPTATSGPWVTPDADISARVDGTDILDTKLAALARHRSQVEADGLFFRGAENGQSLFGEEFYRLAKGTPGPVDDDGWETDLFAGI